MYGGEIHLCACYETLSLSTFRSWEFEVTKKLEKGSSRYYKDWRVRNVNSDKVQQWYTKTRVLHAGKVNYNVSQSVLFSLFKTQFHAHRPSFHWTTLPFPSVSILLLLAQVSGFRSMEIPSPSSMIWLPVRCPTILLGSFGSDWCRASLSSTLSSWFPPVLPRRLRAYTYLIILVRTFACSIVSAYFWLRSVDWFEYQLPSLGLIIV